MTEVSITRRLALVMVVAAALLAVSACARGPEVRFVDDHRVYTLAEVERNGAAMPARAAARVAVANAPEVRQRTLARLREDGPEAGLAADLMTVQFPVATKAVPYYVEAATVDGKAVWIILEAWGGRTGDLVYRRLWVFERSGGAILDARTYR